MEPEKKMNGALIGLIVIIIILIIGGIYVLQSSKNTTEEIKNPQTQSGTITDPDTAALDELELNANTIDTSTGVDADGLN